MRKILLTFFTICLTVSTATAQNYTEDLIISVNGLSTKSPAANITVERNADNTACTFSLQNFCLIDEESNIPVGNITLEGVTMVDKGTYYELSTEQTIQITPGDDESIPVWLGPELGDVPIVLSGKLTNTHLSANLDIDMSLAIGQIINVAVGDESTAIKTVASTPSIQNHAVYTLSGTQITNASNASLPKGVYIVNGKKVIK